MAGSYGTQGTRSIPACAGQPYLRDTMWKRVKVDPRVRGAAGRCVLG